MGKAVGISGVIASASAAIDATRARLSDPRQYRGVRALGRLERQRVRRILRDTDGVMILAAGIVGGLGGSIASLMVAVTNHLHTILFGLLDDMRLSATAVLAPARMILVVIAGGLLVGLLTALWRKRSAAIVDPIEANAIHGGRMSFIDSLFVAVQTVLSSGFGASLGLEGGFTQVAGAFGSTMGRALRRRRNDVRMLVAAGTAGAIAGGFGAPFAGAAYGFELIIGSYTVIALAPIVLAAIAGAYASEYFMGQGYEVLLPPLHFTYGGQFFLLIALGAIAGLIGVALMLGVTATERIAFGLRLKPGVRPVVGGLLVAMLGLVTPHALGSGHGGVEMVLQDTLPLGTLVTILIAKLMSSALSIGSGFRGGLFSTSLFLGAVIGAIGAWVGESLGLVPQADAPLFALVGMASFAAAVIGAPMTMALLALEVTNSLTIVSPVLIGVVVAVITVRKTFGYSFATWRFHLRGEAILGGGDIGWVRDMTAGTLRRRDLGVVQYDATPAEVRSKYRLGSRKYVAVVDGTRYLGLLDLAALHEAEIEDRDLAAHLGFRDAIVPMAMPIDAILHLFEQHESEILVVVDDAEKRHVRGWLTEAYVLRRYRQELEARQRELFG